MNFNVAAAEAVLLDENILSVIFNTLGLQRIFAVAAVCTVWADAAVDKEDEWTFLKPLAKIGRGRGCAPGQFQFPSYMSSIGASRTWPRGGVCVVDSHNNRIVLIQSDGEPLCLIGDAGDCVGQFSFPKGVACDQQRIFVVDCNNCRVQSLMHDGTPQLQAGTYGHAEGQLFKPHGITLAGDFIFVCDTENHRVVRYDKQLQPTAFFGSRGVGPLQFNHPRSCAADGDCLYVCDSANHRISCLSLDGVFLRSFGKYGTAAGEFSYPSDVDTSVSLIFVVEPKQRVQVLDTNGLPLQVLRLDDARGDLCGICICARMAFVSDSCQLHKLEVIHGS
mmetsp:Transcript_43039/g.71537  ORF Transcript_43039/g.71537 Transcript_43039/m.71537 type:complete len:334 (-) Transcript_43039:30-1031(-)|eukprot:CAMPEP_0119341550 /NCGR_PEP_ID=MMETSP1333-20130426/102679_1 /TAXON_ID=418940 /ORGANISM="Scyphosphaera apsteinii, Strain RCC1455" /LENGTH=333 /DNA_ID=CAMNT_0007353545 /DNA_START=41 /DNA_END=1042 /DNA_ORIENTATION=-